LSFLARTKLPDPPARSRLVCKRCGAETLYDAFDDSGYGWYAQMWRCRVCGQESFKIWPVGSLLVFTKPPAKRKPRP
jgi:ribosomal protein L37E